MNLLQHRRCLLLGGEKGLIPKGYTQVAGLKPNPSSPTAMELSATKPFTIQIDLTLIKYGQMKGSYPVFYGRNSNLQLGQTNGYPYIGNNTAYSIRLTEGSRYMIEGTFSSVASDARYIIDGVDTGLRRASGTTQFFLLGAERDAYIANAAVHGVKFYKDGVLIKDLLPCKRDADDVYGFYDIVNSEFLASSFVEYTT